MVRTEQHRQVTRTNAQNSKLLTVQSIETASKLAAQDMRGRSSGTDGAIKTAFGQRITGGLERAFDLRDPYKLNRAPLLRGGKRGLTSIGSIVCALLGIALLIGIGVLIGRELVRPPRRSWEGETPFSSTADCR